MMVTIGTHPVVIKESEPYIGFPMESAVTIFQQGVPIGYPLFLRLIRSVSPDFRCLPQVAGAGVHCGGSFSVLGIDKIRFRRVGSLCSSGTYVL